MVHGASNISTWSKFSSWYTKLRSTYPSRDARLYTGITHVLVLLPHHGLVQFLLVHSLHGRCSPCAVRDIHEVA